MKNSEWLLPFEQIQRPAETCSFDIQERAGSRASRTEIHGETARVIIACEFVDRQKGTKASSVRQRRGVDQ